MRSKSITAAPEPIIKPKMNAAIAPETKADLILPTLKPKTLAKAKKQLAVPVRVSSVAAKACKKMV